MSEVIELSPRCPVCHMEVKATDYFCFNCGKSLHPVPLSTSTKDQAILYIKSALLPPLGIFWGLKYFRQPDTKSKIVGAIAIILTFLIILYAIKFTQDLFFNLTNQINSQLNSSF